jgi:hypothetical protein
MNVLKFLFRSFAFGVALVISGLILVGVFSPLILGVAWFLGYVSFELFVVITLIWIVILKV